MGCLLTKTSHWGKFYKYEQMVKKSIILVNANQYRTTPITPDKRINRIGEKNFFRIL